jgi:TonB-dependent starch-binding outer membrane protein SusC
VTAQPNPQLTLDKQASPTTYSAVGQTINYTYVKNELTDLNRDPIIFGLGGDTQRHTEGRPLGAYYQTPYTFDDANGDGIIGYDEVTLGDSAEYLGNPLPRRIISVTGNLTFLKYFRLSALFDHQGGYKQFNSTEEFRCSAILNCRALYDSTASLFDQARAIAGFQFGTAAGYIEDGTFTRLRELSLTITAPDRYAQRMGVRGIALTLAGRNLALWTDYTGFDPELNFAGQANFSQADFLTQPPARYLTARLDVNF